MANHRCARRRHDKLCAASHQQHGDKLTRLQGPFSDVGGSMPPIRVIEDRTSFVDANGSYTQATLRYSSSSYISQ